ncbi:MAG: hypothetical protein HND52_00245 [Ignavibacteriae bacterium]|nr:hypothetical protein [Ignavibacteriota bacterium]NOG96376.1 hypothetical protein [Ignavibacteriota bacterium]
MEYTIDHLSDKNIVSIKIKGRLNFQLADQYSKEALKLARKNNCNKFLIDHTETDLEGTSSKLHTNGDVLQQFGFKNTDSIAIVVAKKVDVSNFPVSEHGNAKLSSSKYFGNTKIEDAVNWLLTDN